MPLLSPDFNLILVSHPDIEFLPFLQVAGETGDSRRVLQLLSRAVELAEKQAGEQAGGNPANAGDCPSTSAATAAGTSASRAMTVTVNVAPAHVKRAIDEMFETIHMKLLLGCSKLEKLLLVAVVLEMRAAGRPHVQLQVRRRRQLLDVW